MYPLIFAIAVDHYRKPKLVKSEEKQTERYPTRIDTTIMQLLHLRFKEVFIRGVRKIIRKSWKPPMRLYFLDTTRKINPRNRKNMVAKT